jgi:hypothetical protein
MHPFRPIVRGLLVAVFVSLAAVCLPNPSADAQEGEISGGWMVGDMGFASRSRVAPDAVVSIRILEMGEARGIVITYSGNPRIDTPGKLWNREELRTGSIVSYRVPSSFNGAQLAVRSGAASAGLDRPVSVEASEFSYKLNFASGRVLLVSVSRGFPGPGPRPGRADISGGWLVGNAGFASQAHVPQDAVVVITVIRMGNSRGIVVTYSGNPKIDTPGKLWNAVELREGITVRYSVPPELHNARLAVRSGAQAGGLDRPLSVESLNGATQLLFEGGRELSVTVLPPRPRRP